MCPYPDKYDKERVLLKFINPENNKKVYAVKCPNIITPDGEPCINYKFLARKKLNVKGTIRETPAHAGLAQKLTKEILEDLYINQGKSLQDIAVEFGCTRPMVHTLVDRYGLGRRSQSNARLLAIKKGKLENFEHDDINEDFFRNWLPEMAWVLGLLFTDGCLSKANGVNTRVSIHSIDLELLEKIRKHLQSNRKISLRSQAYDKTKRIYVFGFYRQKLLCDLEKLGLVERKSLILKFPDVPKEHIRYFIRGCWDGDGSVFISAGKLRASYVSGSKTFVQTLVEVLYKAGIHRKKLYVDSGDINAVAQLRSE